MDQQQTARRDLRHLRAGSNALGIPRQLVQDQTTDRLGLRLFALCGQRLQLVQLGLVQRTRPANPTFSLPEECGQLLS